MARHERRVTGVVRVFSAAMSDGPLEPASERPTQAEAPNESTRSRHRKPDRVPPVTPLLRAPIVLLTSAMAAGTLLFELAGGDIWWHLRTGQYIAEHLAIPNVDPFSHTHRDAPWRYMEPLAELIYYAADSVAGPSGLVVFHAALGFVLALSIAAWAARSPVSKTARGPAAAGPAAAGPVLNSPAAAGPAAAGPAAAGPAAAGPAAAALAMSLAFAASHSAMPVKPQMYSYLAFVATLLLVRRAFVVPSAAYWLVPLFALWCSPYDTPPTSRRIRWASA